MNGRIKIYLFCLLATYLLTSEGWAMHGARTSYGYSYPSVRGWTYPSYPYNGTYYVDSTPIHSYRYRSSYRSRPRYKVHITQSSNKKKTSRGVFLTE